jgi:hypothetical protein
LRFFRKGEGKGENQTKRRELESIPYQKRKIQADPDRAENVQAANRKENFTEATFPKTTFMETSTIKPDDFSTGDTRKKKKF